jgi:hypothetical protein
MPIATTYICGLQSLAAMAPVRKSWPRASRSSRPSPEGRLPLHPQEFRHQRRPLPRPGGDPNKQTIPVIHDAEIAELRTFDAIYLGAVGHPKIAPGILEKGVLLRLRFDLDQYINLRPVKLYPGVDTPLKDKGPADIDFVVVRENTEGIYTGMGGVQYKGTPRKSPPRSTAPRASAPSGPSATPSTSAAAATARRRCSRWSTRPTC